MFFLSDELSFPSPEFADENGLLAVGGDLSTERLLLAYRNGIFPWYNEEPILWYSPDPRFVLFPSELKISRTMQKLIDKKTFHFTVNKAFSKVIQHCKTVSR